MERYIFVKSYYLFNVIARGPELENSPGRKWVTQQRETGCKVLTSASFFPLLSTKLGAGLSPQEFPESQCT